MISINKPHRVDLGIINLVGLIPEVNLIQKSSILSGVGKWPCGKSIALHPSSLVISPLVVSMISTNDLRRAEMDIRSSQAVILNPSFSLQEDFQYNLQI